jgi:hypothetical protein
VDTNSLTVRFKNFTVSVSSLIQRTNLPGRTYRTNLWRLTLRPPIMLRTEGKDQRVAPQDEASRLLPVQQEAADRDPFGLGHVSREYFDNNNNTQ